MRSMFGATTKRPIQHDWWSILLVLSVISGVVSTPLRRIYRLEINFRRELQSLTPGAEIPPSLVDLQDQLENLSAQLTAATPGTPDFDELTTDVDQVQSSLTSAMNGVAIFVTPASQDDGTASTIADIPLPTESPTLPIESPTLPTEFPTLPTDIPSPQLPGAPEPLPPSLPTTINTPQASPQATTTISTVATYEVTAVIVTTSLGATSTITLATQTVLPTLITTVIQVATPTSANTGKAPHSPKAATKVLSQGATTTPVPTSNGSTYGASTAEVGNGALSRGPSAFMIVAAIVASLGVL